MGNTRVVVDVVLKQDTEIGSSIYVDELTIINGVRFSESGYKHLFAFVSSFLDQSKPIDFVTSSYRIRIPVENIFCILKLGPSSEDEYINTIYI